MMFERNPCINVYVAEWFSYAVVHAARRKRCSRVSIPGFGPSATALSAFSLVQKVGATYLPLFDPPKNLHPHRCTPSVFQTPLDISQKIRIRIDKER
jgi:hypothetical protein